MLPLAGGPQVESQAAKRAQVTGSHTRDKLKLKYSKSIKKREERRNWFVNLDGITECTAGISCFLFFMVEIRIEFVLNRLILN